MRKIVNGPTCQLGHIADTAIFTGCLEDESGYFSDASLYDEDLTEDELFEAVEPEFKLERHDAEVYNRTKASIVEGCVKIERKHELRRCSSADGVDEDTCFEGLCASEGASLSDLVEERANSGKSYSIIEPPPEVELGLEPDSPLWSNSNLRTAESLNRITRSRLAKRLKKNNEDCNTITELTGAANKRTGKRSTARGVRCTWGTAGLGKSEEDSLTDGFEGLEEGALGVETNSPKEHSAADGTVKRIGNKKKAEKGKSCLTGPGRKRTSGRNSRADTNGETAEFETTHVRECNSQEDDSAAEVKEGASVTEQQIGGDTSFLHDVQVKRENEFLALEETKSTFIKRNNNLPSKGNKEVGRGKMSPFQEKPQKSKRGRPRKVKVQESDLDVAEEPGEGATGIAKQSLCTEGKLERTAVSVERQLKVGEKQRALLSGTMQSDGNVEQLECLSKDDADDILGDALQNDTEFVSEKVFRGQKAGNEDSGVKREEDRCFVKTKVQEGHTGRLVAQVGCEMLMEGSGSGTTKVVSGESLIGKSRVGKTGSNKQGETSEACEDVGSATSRGSAFERQAQGALETAVQASVDARSMKKGKVKDKVELSVKKSALIHGSGQTSGSGEEARGCKPRKGISKQVNKLAEIPEKKEMGVVEGIGEKKGKNGDEAQCMRKGSGKATGVARTEGEAEQEVLEGSHKGRKKGIKSAVTEAAEGNYKMFGMSKAKRFVKIKDNESGLDCSNMVSTQRKNKKVATSATDMSAVADNETTELAALNKYSRRSSAKGSKGQNMPKDKDVLLKSGKVAELISDGRSNGAAMKALSSIEDPANGIKERKSKEACSETARHESHVVAHSSTGKPASCKGSQGHIVDTDVRLCDGQAVKDLCASLESVHSVVEQQIMAAGKDIDNGVAGEEVSSGVTEGGEGNKLQRASEKEDDSSRAELGIVDVGWVLCDDCHKWRCIPAELADVIEATNCRWSCQDNPNKDFADCSIPQEKSNAEINAELNISEVSFCEEGDEKDPPVDSKLSDGVQNQDRPQATWTLIKHNIFQHRRRKTQTIDEIMVCQCKPPEDGGVGCGEECLNRMLSIQCIPQTCPCGDLCSNQQFQRRSYAKVGWFRCGRKGFGLQTMEDVRKGTFIIEYVGEVLDMAAYEARQKEYALRGQKHFYFMTLNSNEVIDACVKGNLGRFINHSCEPNCITEKWMINGEVCIGLFAIRDLMKGEEITFDYNYVRVCGAAAKKCRCGSSVCRGFIGGDPMTPLAIVESDSDEDDPEPIMLEEYSEEEETPLEDNKSLIEKKQQGKSEAEVRCALRVPGIKRKWASTETSENHEDTPKRVKTNSSSRKLGTTNTKRLTIETSGGRFEGVEERLNEMLDDHGGLCKRRDAATNYLKLLVVTAASGDMINGEASRSTRDLSMVLDALLKTLSRNILMEIVNKNGLQILHNMIKQFRRNYKKTPIIRKLLKVLEFLATKHVLTIEQINSQPPHYGIESVKDTIHELCRHGDTEVQQIARRFRDKWIPRIPPRKLQRGYGGSTSFAPDHALKDKQRFVSKHGQHQIFSFKDSEDEGSKYRGGYAPHEQFVSVPGDDIAKKRKRQSRWDQPSQLGRVDEQVLDATLAGGQVGGLPQSFWPFGARNMFVDKSHQSQPDHAPSYHEAASSDQLGTRHPGAPLFPPFEAQQLPAVHAGAHLPAVVDGIPVGPFMGAPPRGFIPQQVPVCYGIPVALGQQFNGSQTAGSDCSCSSQTIASSQNLNQNEPGQALALSMIPTDQHQQKPPHNQVVLSNHTHESHNVTFGVSPSQFFQQMQDLFGSVFHPWQVQVLMAPHSWGAHLSGDAKLKDLMEPRGFGPGSWRSGLDGNFTMTGEESEAAPELEPEPPVPGLSPPRPTEPISQQYPGNGSLGNGDVAFHQDEASNWRPFKFNAPRWSKFRGRRYKSFAYRRDFNYPRRYNRPTSTWQGYSNSSRPYNRDAHNFLNSTEEGSRERDAQDMRNVSIQDS